MTMRTEEKTALRNKAVLAAITFGLIALLILASGLLVREKVYYAPEGTIQRPINATDSAEPPLEDEEEDPNSVVTDFVPLTP